MGQRSSQATIARDRSHSDHESKDEPTGKGSAGPAPRWQPTRKVKRAARNEAARNEGLNRLRKLSDIYDLTYRHLQGTVARHNEAQSIHALRAERHASQSSPAQSLFDI